MEPVQVKIIPKPAGDFSDPASRGPELADGWLDFLLGVGTIAGTLP
jgi:hypothetical protein